MLRGKAIPPYPLLNIDSAKITGNAKKVIELCSRQNISAYPVLKAACGFAPAVEAALKAGPEGIFDSSITDLAVSGRDTAGLKRGLLKLSTRRELVCAQSRLDALDYFFVSDIGHIRDLSEIKPGAMVIVAVDSGDLREGVPLDELNRFLAAALKFKKIRIFGAATNHACFSGIVPSAPIIDSFVEKIEEAERKNRFSFEMVSGGNSSLISLIEEKKANPRVNNIRAGEAIFLGSDVLSRKSIAWLEQNTFTVEAEVVECREKESILEGVRTQNAFNEIIDFDKRKTRPGAKTRRAIVSLGKKHFYVNGIKPLENGVFVLGASSDYLIADVSECAREIRCGDTLEFALDYAALMSAMRGAGKYLSCRVINR
jgi:predicted amino acid racemase